MAAWFDTWNRIQPPCDDLCGDYCLENTYATNETSWPTADPPLSAGAPPRECEGITPSVAFSDGRSLRAWVDTTELCTSVWARLDEGAAFLVRGHDPFHAVGSPCAVAGLADRFVVLWNELDSSTGLTSVRLRRIDAPSTLGQIVDVGRTDRPAAVSLFDDGSFAVVWFDDGLLLARLALYDENEPPQLVGAPLELTTFNPEAEGPWVDDSTLTVTVRGPHVTSDGARALVVWEERIAPEEGVIDFDVLYRLVDPLTQRVGRPRRFAFDPGLPKKLGESWQHTAVWRPNGTAACIWTGHEHPRPLPDRNVYCSVRGPRF